jgi:hypothetical protein
MCSRLTSGTCWRLYKSGKLPYITDTASKKERREIPNHGESGPPHFSGNLDGGPKTQPMVWFMVGPLKMRFAWNYDGRHKRNRDLTNSANNAGFRKCIRDVFVIKAIHHGPYNSGDWHQQLKGAHQEYCKSATVHCPLFRLLYPLICIDKGTRTSPRWGTIGHMQATLDGIRSDKHFENLGRKIRSQDFKAFLEAALG